MDQFHKPHDVEPNGRAMAVVDQSDSLMEVISRAASDPQTDVAKLERLMAMYERISGRRSEQAFNEAMNAAQSEMRPVATDAANPQTHSEYASYAALDRALRPIYTKHGFALSFGEGDTTKQDHLRVTCLVTHAAGYSRLYFRDMPADGKGAKGGDVMTKTHASGAAQSYGMRYLLKGIFNIAIGEDDDDGNGGPDDLISLDDIEKITGMIAATNSDIEAFCKYMGVASIRDIPLRHLDKAIIALNSKARKAK